MFFIGELFIYFFINLDEDNFEDAEDKLYKDHHGISLGGTTDASSTRQTRQKKKARKNSESSNGGKLLLTFLFGCYLFKIHVGFLNSTFLTTYTYKIYLGVLFLIGYK